MHNVIRVGDPTSHGGTVIASSATQNVVDGIAVALQGDACICPMEAEGDPNHTINGVPAAYEGHKTTCGALLLATLPNFDKS